VNPYLIAVLVTVIGAVFKIHLSADVAGVVTVHVFVPVAVAALLVAAILALAVLIIRELSGAGLMRSPA
jgi:hypothetical protein